MHPLNWYQCTCTVVEYGALHYIKRLIEEMIEFLSHPSRAEAGDVALMATSVLYALSKHRVLIFFPYARRSLEKGRDRLEAHGCVRSERNRCTPTDDGGRAVLRALFGHGGDK